MCKVIFSDVDGVLTDSRINIGESGEQFKSFNVKDGYGIVEWNKNEKNQFVIITSRESTAVENRASELGIKEVHQEVNNKKNKIEDVANRLGFEFDDAAYIGDDISDLTAINAVGIGCCPADAAQEVKHQCDYVSKYEGGEGAVRDIINYLQNSARTVVGVIDAKYDRTELAGGPLTDIDGEAIINHVIKRMIQTDLLENVIVLTNDKRVIKTVKSPRVDTFVSDSDQDSHIDRISELAQDIQSDFILDIPWNKPLLDSSHVEAVVNTLIEKAPDVATSMSTINQESRLNDDKSIKIVTDVNGKALYLSRSRIPYGGGTGTAYENTSIYAFKKDLLVECGGVESKLAKIEKLEQLRFLEQGYEVQTTKVDCNSPSVDRKNDITLVEKALKEADDYGT